MDLLIEKLQETAEKAENELKKNDEWIKRYANYASIIKNNLTAIKNVRKKFRVDKPLYVYSNISKIRDAKKEEAVTFDLRYRGQSVGNIEYRDNILKMVTKDNTEEFFGIKGGETLDWDNNDARAFRSYFSSFPPNKKDKKESRCESALLTELSKTIGRDKLLKNIQPVRLADCRFQMPTPFSASKEEIEYVAANGGGIDLLCRTKHGNKSILNVFELKDEYEAPYNVLKQIITYSVFINRLFKTSEANSGIWWKLFNFGEIPDPALPLNINAVVALPFNKDRNNDESFKHKIIKLNNENCITLHYFWFDLLKGDKKEDRISNIKTSLFEKITL